MRDQIMTRQAAAKEVALNAPSLPPEIWLLVMQQLAGRRDSASLLACGRLNRSMASLALPMLYGDELANVDSVVFWRSLIASAMGKTLYPYCTWIRSLKLSSLMSVLEDISQQKSALKSLFFKTPLHGFKGMKREAIIVEVADIVTKKIQEAASEADKTAQLLILEGTYFPSACLPTFVSRLPRLTYLALRDGSVLNKDVGQAVRENCPTFKELMCFYCQGTLADADLADFLCALPVNTLEKFTITSLNNIGARTLTALNTHSLSLRRLALMSIEPHTWSAICSLFTPNLTSLNLEPSPYTLTITPEMATSLIPWFTSLSHLTTLELTRFPQTDLLLTALLPLPHLRLTELILRRVEPGAHNFYPHLATQTFLRDLAIHRLDDEDEDDETILLSTRHLDLVSALTTKIHFLRRLITKEPFTLEEFVSIVSSNPLIEELALNGFGLAEEFLEVLGGMTRLKNVNILSETDFSVAQCRAFLDRLREHGEGEHQGLNVYLSQQDFASRWTEREETEMNEEVERRFGFGARFFISYVADPDDLHESDFSD